MIVTGIATDVYNYYNLEKRIVTKNVFDPITNKYGVEYVQYYYTKTGDLEPSKSVGLNVDTYK